MRWAYVPFVLFLALALMIGCAATGSVPAAQQESTPDWTNMEGVWREGNHLYAVGFGTADQARHKDYNKMNWPTADQAYAYEMAKKNARSKLASYAMTLPGSSEWTEVDFSRFQVVRDRQEPMGRSCILARLPVDAIQIK